MLSSGTAITARSFSGSVPFIAASYTWLSIKQTERVSAPSTTWLFVTIKSSESFLPIIIPEP